MSDRPYFLFSMQAESAVGNEQFFDGPFLEAKPSCRACSFRATLKSSMSGVYQLLSVHNSHIS